ncbi:hypothetical protein PIROE2DRAFT_12361 [Piromyces sp. E2]|nr:hypothetical protein PIROE2DRAFT_12361 [Piromyces sp. E2]|eukprot:OUM61581.1 hypothetical protein PIROE2DRAFT_12361 [Piromyces sp. E2]
MTTVNLLCTYYLHGLDGSEKDFQKLKGKVEETFNALFSSPKENSSIVNLNYGYCSGNNAHRKSHAEFSVLSEISFKELAQFLEEKVLDSFKKDHEEKINFETVQHYHLYFSIVGHSLGGLISKGVIKSIFSKFEKDNTTYDNYFEYLKQKYSFLSDIKPCSFITLSSPHLGSLTGKESGAISKRIIRFGSNFVCKFLAGSIGKVFLYRDAKGDEKPVLIKLCEKDYMDTYMKFPNRTLIGCIRHDIPVKFSTAMGSIDMPLPEYEKNHLLIENNTPDTNILSYSGYDDVLLEYYQKEIFNEKVSKDMYSSSTLNIPPPNIDQQIKDGLERLKKKDNKDITNKKYEKIDKNNKTK